MVSKYSTFGYHGGYEQFECVWAVLGYGIIAFYAFCFVTDEKASIYVLRAVAASAGVVGLIGTFQAMGLDFFKTGFMKGILSASVGSEINFTFEENRTYSTLYNPNYVGVFCVLLIPVMISMAVSAKKLWEKITYAVITVLLAVSLVGCQSKTGIIMLAVILVVMALFYRKAIITNKKIVIPVIGLVCLAFVGLVAWRGNEFVTMLKSAFSVEKTETVGWDAIKTSDENVGLCYNGHWFYLSLNQDLSDVSNLLSAVDENGTSLVVEQIEQGKVNVYSADNTIVLPVQYGYMTETELGFIVNHNGQFAFIYKDGSYLYYGGEDKYESLDTEKFERASCLGL